MKNFNPFNDKLAQTNPGMARGAKQTAEFFAMLEKKAKGK